jgi:hypothetical protein
MERDQQNTKNNVEMVEQTTAADRQMAVSKTEGNHVMRSKADELGVWRSVFLFKRVGAIAMIAAFCAALDGYRKTATLPKTLSCRN